MNQENVENEQLAKAFWARLAQVESTINVPDEIEEEIPETDDPEAARDYRQLMIFLARMAKHSYEKDENQLRQWYKHYQPKIINIKDLRIFFATDQKRGRLMLAIRGTDNLYNAFRDLDIDVIAGKPATRNAVARGFHGAYKVIRSQAIAYIKAQLSNGKITKFHICGHSLGGSIANLLALDLINNKHLTANQFGYLATYGQPKTGLEDFAKESNRVIPKANYWRFYIKGDKVPTYPFHATHPWYKHGGEPIKLIRGGNSVVDETEESEDVLHLIQKAMKLDDVDFPNSNWIKDLLKNHAIANYYLEVKRKYS